MGHRTDRQGAIGKSWVIDGLDTVSIPFLSSSCHCHRQARHCQYHLQHPKLVDTVSICVIVIDGPNTVSIFVIFINYDQVSDL